MSSGYDDASRFRRPSPPERLLLVRAALNRERTALSVAAVAVAVAALVIVVIPVISGRIG